MSDQSKSHECLEATARVLIRCFLGGAIFLLAWLVVYVVARDWMYLVHARWFGITREHFELVHYFGLAATKIFIVVGFLIPYICLRLVMRGKP